MTSYGDSLRGVDSKSNFGRRDLKHVEDNSSVDHDPLSHFARQNQHVTSLSGLRGTVHTLHLHFRYFFLRG